MTEWSVIETVYQGNGKGREQLNRIFSPADILIPREELREQFAVVACDQYTSQPEYWKEVERIVGDAPSAYRMILPESALEERGVEERIERTGRFMRQYLRSGVFDKIPDSYVYVERTLRSGAIRRGLVGKIDLTAYDFSKHSASPVRATEATVLERIPPRVQVREAAALEMPHVMLLIDDREDSVIGPVRARRGSFTPLYDFPLMMDSGRVAGWRVDAFGTADIDRALAALADPEAFHERCGAKAAPLVFAVGDGNHSLASAKEHYRRLCEEAGEPLPDHPARYALVEVVNLYDESLEFEPIHRVVYDVDRRHLEGRLHDILCVGEEGKQYFEFVRDGIREKMVIGAPTSAMTVGTLQEFLDEYTAEFGGHCDYIHGEDVVEKLSKQPNTLGFLLPPVDKEELFRAVIQDSVLTRKTFSMGNAWDKRFYLECRSIQR